MKTVSVKVGMVAPTGAVKTANATVVAGWAFDQNAGSAAIDVRVDIDGVEGTAFSADLSQSELYKTLGSANHGWSVAIPSDLAKGRHKVRVEIMDEPLGTWVLLKSLTLTV